MSRGELESCPACRRKWPKGIDHDLRSLGWLGEMPRHISPTNGDLVFHDYHHGPDRFLQFEIKRHGEPMPWGQETYLRALAGQPRWVVRVLRGSLDRLEVQRVTTSGIGPGVATRIERVRGAIADWINGEAWADPRPPTPAPRTCPSCEQMHPAGTTCR